VLQSAIDTVNTLRWTCWFGLIWWIIITAEPQAELESGEPDRLSDTQLIASHTHRDKSALPFYRASITREYPHHLPWLTYLFSRVLYSSAEENI